MTTTQTVPHGKDTATQVELYMSFELGDKSWKLTMSDGRRGPGRYNVDAGDTAEVQGSHNVLVTGPGHPYTSRFWPPGHILGYEHTFILTLADFLQSLENNETFHVNFQDAVNVQRVLHAVEESARTGAWASKAPQLAKR